MKHALSKIKMKDSTVYSLFLRSLIAALTFSVRKAYLILVPPVKPGLGRTDRI